MRNVIRILGFVGMLVLAAQAANPAPPADRSSLVIVFKDGHQQSFSMADIARIEFKSPVAAAKADATVPPLGRKHFVGKWEVGEGLITGQTFFITLEDNGQARKSIGASHGTWELVNGEARISWDDGWHDAIRKVGSKHEKLAFEPGKSFDDSPSNVTNARNTNPKPI